MAAIAPHPNADRLELVTLDLAGRPLQVVTGPHYAVGQLGIYIRPGAAVPGWLAVDLWLLGRGQSNTWRVIGTRPMRGVDSPGIFVGEKCQNDRTRPFLPWPHWQPSWKPGDDVSAYLGVIPAPRDVAV